MAQSYRIVHYMMLYGTLPSTVQCSNTIWYTVRYCMVLSSCIVQCTMMCGIFIPYGFLVILYGAVLVQGTMYDTVLCSHNIWYNECPVCCMGKSYRLVFVRCYTVHGTLTNAGCCTKNVWCTVLCDIARSWHTAWYTVRYCIM
jgi:hypothetical protein